MRWRPARRSEPLARYFECWLLRLQGVYPESRRHAVERGAWRFWRRRAPCRRARWRCVPADARVLRELEACIALIAMHLEKDVEVGPRASRSASSRLTAGRSS